MPINGLYVTSFPGGTMKHVSILYFSASGNTKKVAGWIAEKLSAEGITSELYSITALLNGIPDSVQSSDMIIIGTPTFMWHTPPVVKEFVEKADIFGGKPVGVFATYGMVTVGANLSWMSKTIRRKGGLIAGFMKIEAQHSMMFKGGRPLGRGKPDECDREAVKEFVSRCIGRAISGVGISKIPGIMKYIAIMSPPVLSGTIMPELKIMKARCTCCGACVRSCPTGNITITDGALMHGDNCLLCYNCVRACPEGATDANLRPMETLLRVMSHLPDRGSAAF